MSLSCSCDFDVDNCDWWWEEHSKVLAMPVLARRKRCCSCKELINVGEDVFKFYRYRKPNSEVEERIHGDSVAIAPQWTCETCSGLITSIEDLGMCYTFDESLKHQIAEYRQAEKEMNERL